jgi:transketolase
MKVTIFSHLLTTLLAMTELYSGATKLELQAITEIVAVAMDAPAKAKSGHSGTAMALAPFGVALFSRVMRHEPADPMWLDRDRFILSCGHASILQYGLVHAFGYELSEKDLQQFRSPHSKTPGHPEAGETPTVEVTTGPLGQGIANGVGMALAERMLRAQFGEDLVSHRTWVIAGDGCLEEGISHEAASFAGAQGLDRLTVIYDDNHITIDGATELALRDDAAARFRSYGWDVIELGEKATDLDAIEKSLRQAIAETTKPTLVVLRSHIGFPSPAMQDRREAHGSPFSAEAISEAKAILGVADTPFSFDSSLPESLRDSLVTQHRDYQEWQDRAQHNAQAAQALVLQTENNGALLELVDVQEFPTDSPVATRKAMQRVMDAVSAKMPGLTAGSADLTENTGVVIKNGVAQGPDTPDGRQIYYGIREFAMGAIMVGQALHGGIRPIGSTFFVFADYVRPAIRLAALSHASTLFVFTHDSIGVGEDGPTHQPIEHLMSLRAMPRLHVVRPSDANETLHLTKQLLVDATMAPTALVLSRQDLPVLSGIAAEASRDHAHRGGYVAMDDPEAVCTIIATGSEVGISLAAAEALSDSGLPTRVVAMPCWACFDSQSAEYQNSVLRQDLPSLAVEAGATLGWYKYADEVLGIDRFGISAPASFIFEEFGITATAVVSRVRSLMESYQ